MKSADAAICYLSYAYTSSGNEEECELFASNSPSFVVLYCQSFNFMCTCVYIPAPPNTGLYFTLSGTVYLPGDTILITEVGKFINSTQNTSNPETSLVCVTTNVNTHCCRGKDNPNGGSRGEWYLPDGTRILNTLDANFYRTRYTQQVRLSRRNDAMSPTGVFTCKVPNDGDDTMPFTATIRLGECNSCNVVIV